MLKCYCGLDLEVVGENAAELREECPEHGADRQEHEKDAALAALDAWKKANP